MYFVAFFVRRQRVLVVGAEILNQYATHKIIYLSVCCTFRLNKVHEDLLNFKIQWKKHEYFEKCFVYFSPW